MEINELKKELLNQIEKLGQNAEALTNTLRYIESMGSTDDNRPFITDDEVAYSIKDDSGIIVPVVCDDMFVYVKEGKSLSIGDFLIEKFTSERRLNNETAKAIKDNLYYGLSLYEQDKQGKNLSNSIYKTIEESIDRGDIKLRDCVKEFLLKGDFPLIVTTMGFEIIESSLSNKGYVPEWYRPNKRNDLPFVKNEQSRVVYHIFGGESPGTWVYNEQTLLHYVHALQSGDYSAKNLANYLRGTGNESVKRPLVLGSTLPNWLFRLFVYPLYGEKLSESNGYWLSLDSIEKGLDMFLLRNKYTGQTDLRGGNRVDEILSEATFERNEFIRKKQKPYKIFVSYKREQIDSNNAEIIERIFSLLRKQAKETGGDVWRDVEQVDDGGNPYWANIKKAIKECNLFIPLVSIRYLNEFRDAPDITKYAEKTIIDAELNKANDAESIMLLNPVVREAYYAIAYGKKCAPIVIKDHDNLLNGSTTESIIKDSDDNRNLPACLFLEHTNLVHDDNNPNFFILPNVD